MGKKLLLLLLCVLTLRLTVAQNSINNAPGSMQTPAVPAASPSASARVATPTVIEFTRADTARAIRKLFKSRRG
jgi:hypothetical protein